MQQGNNRDGQPSNGYESAKLENDHIQDPGKILWKQVPHPPFSFRTPAGIRTSHVGDAQRIGPLAQFLKNDRQYSPDSKLHKASFEEYLPPLPSQLSLTFLRPLLICFMEQQPLSCRLGLGFIPQLSPVRSPHPLPARRCKFLHKKQRSNICEKYRRSRQHKTVTI